MKNESISPQPRITVIKIIFLAAPLIFVAAGVFLIAVGMNSYQKTKLTESYSRAAGVVKSARIQPFKDDEATVQYAPKIEYQYSVDGKSYSSNNIQVEIFVHFHDEDDARQFLSKYPAGSNIQIYYNPNHSNESVLEAKPAPIFHIVTAMGIFCCCLALLIYYSYYRDSRTNRTTNYKSN